jgi:peroxiredoxin
MFVDADTDNFDPGPSIGSKVPQLNAIYRGQNVTSIDSFAGQNGTVLIASRSVDWCPYCMRQLLELQQHKALFDEAGLGLVAITYDSPQLQKKFTDKHDIDLPLLSDVNAQTFTNLNILNAQYLAGDERYGLPYPGMVIISNQGIVVGKLFVEAYSLRVDAKSSLAYALDVLSKENSTKLP